MPLPAHLFISSSDGALYDTRPPTWASDPPLRANYERGHPTIETTADLRAVLRNGSHAWPGGYPMFFVMSDGESMSFDAIRANLRDCLGAIVYPSRFESGWRPVAIAVNWEDSDLYCAHSGNRIPSAYGDDSEGEPA